MEGLVRSHGIDHKGRAHGTHDLLKDAFSMERPGMVAVDCRGDRRVN